MRRHHFRKAYKEACLDKWRTFMPIDRLIYNIVLAETNCMRRHHLRKACKEVCLDKWRRSLLAVRHAKLVLNQCLIIFNLVASTCYPV